MKKGQTKRNRALRVNLGYVKEPVQQYYYYMDIEQYKRLQALMKRNKPWKQW
jgi:hypothetical protein